MSSKLQRALHVTETEFMDAVIVLAQIHGWKVVHIRPARTAKGWVTPVQADGKGWFDLTLVHPKTGYILFVECKDENGKLRPEQEAWQETMKAACEANDKVEVDVWRPSDWENIQVLLKVFGNIKGV